MVDEIADGKDVSHRHGLRYRRRDAGEEHTADSSHKPSERKLLGPEEVGADSCR